MRFLRQSMIGLFLASVTLGLLIYAFQIVSGAIQTRLSEDRPAPPARERVFVVDLVRAEAQTETPVLNAFGEIAARRTLELRAAVGGRIIALAPTFEEGGAVSLGDVLVTIDPSDMQSQVDRLSADLADAEAEVRDAERGLELARLDEDAARAQSLLRAQALDRQVGLADRGVGSAALVETAKLAAAAADAVVITRQLSVTQAEARVDQAATRLARSQIALADAQRDLRDTTIVAPFPGTLGDTAVVAGGLVSANERLATLVDPAELEVSFRLSTAQYARLLDSSGQIIKAPVTLRLEAADADLTATGRISRVSAATGEGQTGRLVFAQLDPAPGFRPGDFVSVIVLEPALENVVRLPSTALGPTSKVMVLGQGRRLEAIEVDLLRRQGDDILVRGFGLEGRDVVQELTPLLGEGISVRAARKPGAASENAEQSLLELSAERRAELVEFIRQDRAMPEVARARIIAQLEEAQVPALVVERIERRMGG